MDLATTLQFSKSCSCGTCKTCKLKVANMRTEEMDPAAPDVDPKVPGASKTPFGHRVHKGKIAKRKPSSPKFAVKPRKTLDRLSPKKLGSVMDVD